MMWRQRRLSFFWLVLLMLCWGCAGSGTPVAYYTLQPAPDGDLRGKDPAVANLIIGIGPVSLPRHLDRAAIVTRISPNRLKVNDRHRWAGSLQADILGALAVHIEDLAQVKEVVVFPWPTRIEPDLRFRIEIHSFEGDPGKGVTLKASWSLTAGASDQPAVRRTSLIQVEAAGGDIEATVSAMTNALAKLSGEMADAIEKARP